MKRTITGSFAVVFGLTLLPCSLWSARLTSEVKISNGMPAPYVNGIPN
jgi:hypothetical protein